jgi:phosphohistidine phosphatase
MTKTLFIVRHAKSCWDYDDISDIDRPLSIRGINDAGVMAGRLKAKGDIPSLLISSPANRALHTATIFSRTLKGSSENLVIEGRIYPGSINEILNVIENISDRYDSIMIFGHNPASTGLANHFLKHPIDNLPTAGVVTLNFNGDSWKNIKDQEPKSEYIDFPKKS